MVTTGTSIKIGLISVAKMHPHPHNIRQDTGDVTGLAASLAAAGQLQTCLVQPHTSLAGEYLILIGERRWTTAVQEGRKKLLCIVTRPQTRSGATKIMLMENGHRLDLNPMEWADAFGILRDGDGDDEPMTPRQIEAATGFPLAFITRHLMLLDHLTADTQERVRNREVTMGQAIAAIRRERNPRRRAARGAAHPGVTDCEPDYGFTRRNPLAAAARALCKAAGHDARRKYGSACSACWDQAIRQDERDRAAAGQDQGAAVAPGERRLYAVPAGAAAGEA
jgi:ParB/RepB/Spo0J family partition protein